MLAGFFYFVGVLTVAGAVVAIAVVIAASRIQIRPLHLGELEDL